MKVSHRKGKYINYINYTLDNSKKQNAKKYTIINN